MIKATLIAGALLAVTGATMAPASAAAYRVTPIHRGAAAYRTPIAQTRFRAPVRAAVRLPYHRTLAAAPLARVGYGRIVRPAYGRVAQQYGRYAYRGAHRLAQPVRGRYAYRGYGHGHYARRAVPAGAQRLVALAPSTLFPSAAMPAVAPAATGSQMGGGTVGGASYYSGGRTASGGFVGAATCAHRTLPFGTRLLVTNLTNARATVCTVNDRGPFIGGRVVDLSRGAAGAIGMLGAGVARVRLQIVGRS